MKEMIKTAVGPNKPWHADFALLFLRVGIGLIFMRFGYLKLVGGPESWAKLGMAMGNVGIHFWPTFWGLCAAIAEFGGGISLVLGLFMRKWVIFMAIVMSVAVVFHLKNGDSFTTYSYPLAMFCVFFALLLLGSGRYSLDALLYRKL